MIKVNQAGGKNLLVLSYGSKRVISTLPFQKIYFLIHDVMGGKMRDYNAAFLVVDIFIHIQEKLKGLCNFLSPRVTACLCWLTKLKPCKGCLVVQSCSQSRGNSIWKRFSPHSNVCP